MNASSSPAPGLTPAMTPARRANIERRARACDADRRRPGYESLRCSAAMADRKLLLQELDRILGTVQASLAGLLTPSLPLPAEPLGISLCA